MKRMRVCVVTGTRAELGIWHLPMRMISHWPGLELKLVVTGTHLMKEFGQTVRTIEQLGLKIDARVPMYRSGEPAAKSLGRGIEGLARAYRQVGAEMVLVLGDRLEMLAAASAALAERIPIGHVHGGETAPGVWDEQIRHAITKMAQVHFCATKTAARRIVRMGEPPERVHVVGAPALDLATVYAKSLREFADDGTMDLGALWHRYPVLLLHPSGEKEAVERSRALQVIRAMRKVFKKDPIRLIGPNNDPGYRGILQAYAREKKDLTVEMSVQQELFWSSLALGGILVGNSSSGIIEAATFGCAVVNIGERQAGRERNGNVIDVPWEAGEAGIVQALRKATTDKAFLRRVALRKNVYGDGKASEKIVAVLEEIARKGIGLEKRFRD